MDSVFQEVCDWIIYQHISIWPLIFFHLQSIEPPLSKLEILKSVSQSLMSLWLEAAASPVGTGGIRNKIRKLIERVEVFKKIPAWRRKGSWFPHVLFDITSCTCLRGKDLKRNLKIDTSTCESNLSKAAIKFIQDQRGPRHMRILSGSLIDVGQAKQHSTVDGIMMQVHVNQAFRNDSKERNERVTIPFFITIPFFTKGTERNEAKFGSSRSVPFFIYIKAHFAPLI